MWEWAYVYSGAAERALKWGAEHEPVSSRKLGVREHAPPEDLLKFESLSWLEMHWKSVLKHVLVSVSSSGMGRYVRKENEGMDQVAQKLGGPSPRYYELPQKLAEGFHFSIFQ